MNWRLLPALLLTLLLLLPPLLLLLMSLSEQWRYPALWPQQWQAGHWRLLIQPGQPWFSALLHSIVLALTVSFSATLSGFFTSFHLAARRHSQRWLLWAVLPFAVSPVVLALSLNFGFIRLQLAGNVAGVALAQYIFAYAYACLLLNALWNRRMHAMSELAVAMGASQSQLWRRVRWPLAKDLLAVCWFQTFLMSWYDFALARIIGAGQVRTLPVLVFDYFSAGDIRVAASASLLLLLPPVLVMIINYRWLNWSVWQR